jgi:arylamine N-acetyltransferase
MVNILGYQLDYLGLHSRSHMVNLVTLDGQKYLVDVGFGADSPCRPLPLISEYEVSGVSPQMLRLQYKSIRNNTDSDQRSWVYSHKRQPQDNWSEAYAFVEIEFFPEDFAVMNLGTMRDSFFSDNVMCTKSLLSTETNELEGSISLYRDEVKKKLHGEIVETCTLSSEADRVSALETWFGIQLTEEEKQGIKSKSSCLN